MLRSALRLAKHYGCSPFAFLDLPDEVILNLYEETIVVIREDRNAS